jgi:hypothetical protein
MAGARFLGAEPGMPGRLVKNAPFTADIVSERTQTLADGNHIRQTTTEHVSRDSEGRMRRDLSLNGVGALLGALAANGNMPQVAFISDPVAGVSYTLNAGNKTAVKTALRQPRMAGAGSDNGPQTAMARPGGRGMRANQNQNVKTDQLGSKVIEGVTAQGTRTTLTIPAGQMGNEQPIQIVSERWYSSELQEVVQSTRSDPRSGETTMSLKNISRAEPPATSFQVPSDYKVSEGSQHPGRGAQQ